MNPPLRRTHSRLGALLALAVAAGAGAADDARGPAIRLRLGAGSGRASFDVVGLAPADLEGLSKGARDRRTWAEIFAIYVGDAPVGDAPSTPPVLGDHRVEGGVLRFEPRFPPVPGLRYRAVFRPGALPGRAGAPPITADLAIPAPAVTASTAVERVYPSRAILPENQLKFYLHFSAPMGRGDAYDQVHLLDAAGREIDGPFLRLDEELWDGPGRRLTLLIDPGRIKREVGPREGFGPVLEAGKSYTLVVDRSWPDARGVPLKASYRKTFRVTAADEASPDLGTWRLRPPAAGTPGPLVVNFPEPLDHALLGRLLRVRDGSGGEVAGAVAIDDEETRWSFTPERPWKAGPYRLVVDPALEDLAGNSLLRPFELDQFRQVERRPESRTLERPFEVRGAPDGR